MDVHEVLVAARNLYAWEGSTHCASTAITAAYDDPPSREFHGVFLTLIGLPDPGDACQRLFSVWHWHDTLGRTRSDVLAAFDKAIAATAPAPADPGLPVDVKVLV